MNDNKISAAILTAALWNSREKTTAKQIGADDWKLVVEDYVNILSELIRRQTQ